MRTVVAVTLVTHYLAVFRLARLTEVSVDTLFTRILLLLLPPAQVIIIPGGDVRVVGGAWLAAGGPVADPEPGC